MRFFYALALVVFSTLCLSNSSYAQTWLPTGIPDANQATITRGDINDVAVAPDGSVYLAFADSVQGGKLTVRRNVAGTWMTVGSAGFSSAAITSVTIKVNSANIPYVLYQQVSGTYANAVELTMVQFVGGSWLTVGTAGFATQFENVNVALPPNQTADFDFNSTDIPYVVYQNYDGGTGALNATVKRFSSGTWNTVGATNVSGAGVYSAAIAIDRIADVPYIYFFDFGTQSKVMRFQSGSWSMVGADITSGNEIPALDLAIAPGQIPMLAYLDGTAAQRIYVREFTGGAWSPLDVTDAPVENAQTVYPELSVSASGEIYVTLLRESDSLALAKHYNGGNWENVGSYSLSPATSKFVNSTIDGAGNLIASYQDALNRRKISVKQFSSGEFTHVGGAGAAGSVAFFPEIQYTGTNIPFIAYRDADRGFAASARVWNGTAWVQANAPAFSAGAVNYVSLAIRKTDNVPYVAYSDAAASNKLSVQFLAVDGWTYAGMQGVSSGAVSQVKAAAAPNGNIYVAFADASFSNRLTVMVYNGTTWSTVGSAGSVSSGAVSDVAIAVNAAGNILVGYSDASTAGTAGRLVVRSYAGSWTNVGTNPVSTQAASSISVAYGEANVPVVAYRNGTGGAEVRYFSGSWQNAGTTAVSTGPTSAVKMITVASYVFLAYQDNSLQGRATVLSLNNLTTGSWTAVGAAGQSTNAVTSLGLSMSPNGFLSLVYNDNYAWVRTYEIGVLPVKLSRYEVKKVDQTAEISWTTTQETNSAYFVIERSADGSGFTAIGTLAAAGNSSTALNYSFVDAQPVTGYNYYRLVEVDADGKKSYFETKRLYFGAGLAFQAYPNPATSTVTLRGQFSSQDQIQILDLTGKVVLRQRAVDGAQVQLNISRLPAGLYVLKVDGANQHQTVKLQKQ